MCSCFVCVIIVIIVFISTDWVGAVILSSNKLQSVKAHSFYLHLFKTILPTSLGVSSYSLNINIFVIVMVMEQRQFMGAPTL